MAAVRSVASGAISRESLWPSSGSSAYMCFVNRDPLYDDPASRIKEIDFHLVPKPAKFINGQCKI